MDNSAKGYVPSETDGSDFCVSGETPILTKMGYFPIMNFLDKEVEVWNGSDWSKVTIKQTTSVRHLLTVFFSNGSSLTCTPDHNFIIGIGTALKQADRIPAQFLAKGMELRQELLPIIEGECQFKYPYIHGAMCSFGCFTEKGPIMDIMGPALSAIVNHPDMVSNQISNGFETVKVFPDDLLQAYTVPINSSVVTKLQWLAGFLDARSFISKMGVSLININDTLLQDIQLLLTTLGVCSVIEKNNSVKVPLGNGKLISLRNYTLIIPWKEFKHLVKLGLPGAYSTIEIPDETQTIPLIVKDIVDIGRMAPAYFLVEPINNAVVYNGILTG